jgi:peptide deformylase
MIRILSLPNPILRKKARALRELSGETRKLIQQLCDTLHQADPPGIGLAATQIGVAEQVAIIDIGEGLVVLVNPRIIARRGKFTSKEGCLSVPGIYADVERAAWVKVKALNRDGKPIEIEGNDLMARVLQHEIDHLNGMLFIDRVTDWQSMEVLDGYSIPTAVEALRKKHGNTSV